MADWTLKSKKALVTGGTKGIGLAIVKEFLDLGAEVLVVARDTKSIQGRLKNSANLFTMDGDVSDASFRKQLSQKVNENWGKLDILVNNVGTNIRKKFVEYSEEEYRKLFEVNLFSLTEITRLSFDVLKNSGSASVINIASVAGSFDLRLIDTGVAVYGDHVLRSTQGPLFATANYTDEGTFNIPPPAKDRFDIAVVVSSPQPWDLDRIYARGDEKLNGGLTELLKIPPELAMEAADYESVRATINRLPISDAVHSYINFAIASLRFSEAASDEVARMTKGNAWAEQDTGDLHYVTQPHTLTKNELSVRCAKSIQRYAAALAWFTGKDEVDMESVKTVFPYTTWHRLEPSEKMLTEKRKYANDRIGFAQHVLEEVDKEWMLINDDQHLDIHRKAHDAITTGYMTLKDKEGIEQKVAIAKEKLPAVVGIAIKQLADWDHPYGLSLAKNLESTYNERMMRK